MFRCPRRICCPDVSSVFDVVFVVVEVSKGLLGIGCYYGVTASD